VSERVVLVTRPHGFYLAVKVAGRYYRLAIWQYGLRWHLGRS
jgi:hypothetical protein